MQASLHLDVGGPRVRRRPIRQCAQCRSGHSLLCPPPPQASEPMIHFVTFAGPVSMLVGDRGASRLHGGKLAGDNESDNVTRRHCVAGFTAAATAPDRGYSSTLATWTPLRSAPASMWFAGGAAIPVTRPGLLGSGSLCWSFPGRRTPPGLSNPGELRRPPRPPTAPPAPLLSASSAASGSASSPLARLLAAKASLLGFFGRRLRRWRRQLGDKRR